MERNLLFKANPLLLSNKSKNFHRNLYCTKYVQFRANSEFNPVKRKCFMNSTSISTSKRNIEGEYVRSTFKDRPPANSLLNTILNWMRIPLVVLVLFSLIMHRHKSALAFSGGVMGGDSFSDSHSHSHSHSFSDSDSDSDDHYISKHWRVEDGHTDRETHNSGFDEETEAVIVFGFIVFLFIGAFIDHCVTQRTVIKLQMSVLVNGQSLRKDLNQIAKTTDTSTSDGWRRILNGTIQSILQHLDNVISHDLIYEWKDTSKKAKKCFKQFSNEERAKFKTETLVNLNNMKKEKLSTQIANQSMNTYIVVTILMAVEGSVSLPVIIDREDLKKAFEKLQSIYSSYEIKGLNILWAPQEENEIMSLDEVKRNYPRLEVFCRKRRFFWRK